jgi:glutamate dehydrogenase
MTQISIVKQEEDKTQEWGLTMQNDKKQRKSLRLVDIAQTAVSTFKPEEIEKIRSFIHLFYNNIAVENLIDNPTQQLAGSALCMWSFLQKRQKNKPEVRIYNPSIDQHGWTSSHTVIEIINNDMPFLVDSITAELSQLQINMHLFIHPILYTERDDDGNLLVLKDIKNVSKIMLGAGMAESVMQIHIDRQHSEEGREQIKKNIENILQDVRVAVEDWVPMEHQLKELITDYQKKSFFLKTDVHEDIEFLNWLSADHYTFLGYREYLYEFENGLPKTMSITGPAYGILRNSHYWIFDYIHAPCPVPEESLAFFKDSNILFIKKANRKSTVHRRVHLDTLIFKKLDDQGNAIGEGHLTGLFTSSALRINPAEIPLLRQKVKQNFLKTGFDYHTHDGKTLLHILNTFPHDELFQITEDQLYEMSNGILEVRDRPQIALFLRPDPFERYISCFLYIPRDRYNSDLRKTLQNILENSFNGHVSAFYTQLTDDILARVHIIFKTRPGEIPNYNAIDLEKQLIEASRSWPENLQVTLLKKHNEITALSLFQEFKNAFPNNYKDVFQPDDAIVDIKYILNVLTEQIIGVNLYQPSKKGTNSIRLKLYNYNTPIVLSNVLPMFECLGLKTISEGPFEIQAMDQELKVWIHDFKMEFIAEPQQDFEVLKKNFEAAFRKLWEGRIEKDNFNRLVTSAGLTWRQVIIFRAYSQFLKQLGIPFSQGFIQDVLTKHVPIVQKLNQLFFVRFDPEKNDSERSETQGLIKSILKDLNTITNINEDRVIRLLLNAITSTLRTNYFQKHHNQKFKNYVSFKFNSRALEEMPQPRPLYEIFVYSPQVNGIHLRGGKVARGGLRYSDRPEDLRTEILGLMKAQMVKNAVIVPVGSKGGFVVKTPKPTLETVQKCYKTYISALLDITDNFKGTEIVPPPHVVCYDEADPYLVVAADKGTATFSDLANEVSAEYHFWLGDAFASGGSQGYDHKKMAITARGAWESVKRHFRELGHDIQKEPFTVIGVGDMAGDVFGNGMLQSRFTKLVAAFNHQHIFIDPSPNLETSYQERERLFNLPKSSWMDYNAALISEGGGIFSRDEKTITLSPEIRSLLGIEEEILPPNKLIGALLKAQVDLLWFGGIGTFIKASFEYNSDAGDRTNDPLRIDARDLRCRVLGEGANLAITQNARIEYAFLNGRLNTDSIDNAGGVNCSDHEVNIKILLKPLVDEGKMTLPERNKLLEDMTQEVADLVIRDNYLQTQAISIIESYKSHFLAQQGKLIQTLEKISNLDTALEKLPNNDDLKERQLRDQGLTRPEIAILLSHSKMVFYNELMKTNFDEDKALDQQLISYFPSVLQTSFKKSILTHRLRKEITATVLTNTLINRVGMTFPFELMEKVGCKASDITRAFIIAHEIFNLNEIWNELEHLDLTLQYTNQMTLAHRMQRFTERIMLWLLRHCELPLEIQNNKKFFSPGIEQIAESLPSLVDQDDLDNMQNLIEEFIGQGTEEKLARRVVSLSPLTSSLDIIRIAYNTKIPVFNVAHIYYNLGKRFEFNWMRHHLRKLRTDNSWQKNAIECLIDDLFSQQATLVVDLVSRYENNSEGILESWMEEHQETIRVIDDLLRGIKSSPLFDLSMFVVANNQIRSLIRD